MQPAITVENLTKSYKGKRLQTVLALDQASFSVAQGEVFGFIGPNGAGKSTTIKILVGLIRANAGQAEIFGIPVTMPKARQRVGYLPENPAFYDFLSAYEYLRFVGQAFKMPNEKIIKESARVLELLDLTTAAKRPIRGYSKGMVQRLGLAQALLHDPDLYILDEPMSGLDPLGRALVKDIILDLKKRAKTVFFSTHVTADVERVCDRVGVIVGGVFREERVVDELLREGIDGYFCRIRGLSAEDAKPLGGEDCGGGVFQLFVERSHFDNFASTLLQKGGSFDLVEPRRRDIEDYFLNIVKTSRVS